MFKTNKWMFSEKDIHISLQKWQKTVDLMTELFSAPAGFIVQSVDSGYRIVIASEQQENPYDAGTFIPNDVNIFCKKVVTDNSALYEKHASKEVDWLDNPEVTRDGFESYLGLPIHWPNGEVFGTLCVMDFEQTDYQRNYLELIKQLRDMVEDDLEMVNNFVQMREIAMLDPLTNIYNRRALSLLAQQKINLASRLGFDVCCLFIDVNDFKKLNDQFGHEVGDTALMVLADTLRTRLRDADIVGRLGGDEFIAVIQITDKQLIDNVLDKIHDGYKTALAEKSLPSLSLSIGCSFSSEQKEPFETLLDKADQEMYKNKQAFKRSSE
jgi:diguanylate cyclase (GGDEF)-like protein